jgi:signal transduction histidine kinase
VFTGPVDLLVTGGLAEDVAAVVRECLANIARHARAGMASVEIDATDDGVTIVVEDDGVGLPEEIDRRSGTSNLAERAVAWQGAYTLLPRAGGGTRASWSATWTPGGTP